MFKISDKVKSYALRTVGVVLCLGLVWGNFQIIDAKNERISALNADVERVTTEKKALEEVIAKKIESDGVTVKAKEDVVKKEVVIEKAKTVAEQYVSEKLQEIDKKYDDKEKTPVNDERKRVEISLERAKGLWLTFCLQEPEEKACK